MRYTHMLWMPKVGLHDNVYSPSARLGGSPQPPMRRTPSSQLYKVIVNLQGRATADAIDLMVHAVWLEGALPPDAERRPQCVRHQPLPQVYPWLDPEELQAGGS